MPEPISSSSSIPWTPADPDPSPDGLDEEGGVCEDPHSNVGPLAELADDGSEGATALASRYEASSRPSLPTDSNAQRTTARQSSGFYADAGLTSSGDSAFAGVAVGKKHDPEIQADAEFLSASVQGGVQNEAQVGVARVGDTEGKLTGSVETLTARAHAGFRNDDGSVGINVGAGATALGGEATYTTDDGSSLTGGVAASVGLSGSIGLRDADGDGRKELCLRYSGVLVTVGACVER